MAGFEQAFSDAEKAAEAAQKAAADLGRIANALRRAAQKGTIAAVRREQSKLGAALEALQGSVSEARSCWPFSEEQEVQYLKDGYAAELLEVATEKGVKLYERDDRIIAPPSIMRILPGNRAVMIDRKRRSDLKPSHMVNLLGQNQGKSGTFAPSRFLEALYLVYTGITGRAAVMSKQGGGAVALNQIYQMMTSLPGSNRDYSRTDFARDLYTLESQGPHQVKDGAEMSLSSGRTGVFTFVDSNGASINYAAIRFLRTGK